MNQRMEFNDQASVQKINSCHIPASDGTCSTPKCSGKSVS